MSRRLKPAAIISRLFFAALRISLSRLLFRFEIFAMGFSFFRRGEDTPSPSRMVSYTAVWSLFPGKNYCCKPLVVLDWSNARVIDFHICGQEGIIRRGASVI